MSQRPTVSGKSVRGIPMSMSGRGRGRSPRIPVNIQPISTRVITGNQNKRPYESSSDESSSSEVEWEEDQAVVSSAETQGIQLPALGQINTPEVSVKVRGRARSDGGISEIAPKASNKRSYCVSFRGTRRNYYTRAAAEAALALFRTGTMCAGCDRTIPFECEQCGHVDTTPAYQTTVNPAPAAVNPVNPEPVIPVNADPVQIRCRAIAPGVLSVTLNGVTFTTRGVSNTHRLHLVPVCFFPMPGVFYCELRNYYLTH
jgi:hypothetical protein